MFGNAYIDLPILLIKIKRIKTAKCISGNAEESLVLCIIEGEAPRKYKRGRWRALWIESHGTMEMGRNARRCLQLY